MEFDDTFEYDGRSFSVRLAFDNVLLLLELLQDNDFNYAEKIDISLELMINEYKAIQNESIEVKFNLFKFILKEFLEIDLEQPAEENPPAANQPAASTPKKTYCFTQDAGIIYASFFRSYQIDLFEVRGKLHWKKFLQLLLHMDDKSKFKEVINIRTMKVPKPTKYNAEYRKDIQKMKRIYALEDTRTEQEKLQEMNAKLNALAEHLKKQ
jgi:hypothetical protein